MTFKFWTLHCSPHCARPRAKKRPRKYILCTIVMGSHLIGLVHNLH